MVKLNLCIAKELLLILLIRNKNENKSHFFLFFASFFVPFANGFGRSRFQTF